MWLWYLAILNPNPAKLKPKGERGVLHFGGNFTASEPPAIFAPRLNYDWTYAKGLVLAKPDRWTRLKYLFNSLLIASTCQVLSSLRKSS